MHTIWFYHSIELGVLSYGVLFLVTLAISAWSLFVKDRLYLHGCWQDSGDFGFRVWMGGVCPGCLKGSAQEDKPYYAQAPHYAQPAAQPQQQQQRQARSQPQQKSSEEDRARSDEARANAAIAAQKRSYIQLFMYFSMFLVFWFLWMLECFGVLNALMIESEWFCMQSSWRLSGEFLGHYQPWAITYICIWKMW